MAHVETEELDSIVLITLITLIIYKLSGKEFQIQAEVSNGVVVSLEGDSALRAKVFDAFAKGDADFPAEAAWFLDGIDFVELTPNQENSTVYQYQMIFPQVEIHEDLFGWVKNYHAGEGFGSHQMADVDQHWGLEEFKKLKGASEIVVGRWSDPVTLRVGLYLANTPEQRSVIANFITKVSVCLIASDKTYLDAILKICASDKLPINSLKTCPSAYTPDVRYDTTLWHLLLESRKRLNYEESLRIMQTLFERRGLDFSQRGWSWAKKQTISAAELCFYEWCSIASGRRQLWAHPTGPRLYLLAACLYVPQAAVTTSHCRATQGAKQIKHLMDKEQLFWKKSGLLQCLFGDLGLLNGYPCRLDNGVVFEPAKDFPPKVFLESVDVPGVMSHLEQEFMPSAGTHCCSALA